MKMANRPILRISEALYAVARPAIFKLTNCETIHNQATALGEVLGKSLLLRGVIGSAWCVQDPALEQTISGIKFPNPFGLAAGFDYDAHLTQILPALGLGFASVGTVTNNPYGGNPRPMLARLPKSQSLLVNKGFKSAGIHSVLSHLKNLKFEIPIGISLGKTNSQTPMTQTEAVTDVVAAFKATQASGIPFAYYEMNISCPNLFGNVEFYAPNHLDELLTALDALNLNKPLYIKMPIDKTDQEVSAMLEVIAAHKVAAVIFGNLWKDRSSPDFVPAEIKAATKGNFSGKPTEKRSNELISLAYKSHGKKLTIIGCGGVFNAQDAYTKIRLGASLVQLVTGLIYRGPQLAGNINLGLLKLLKKDGYANISQAVGTENK